MIFKCAWQLALLFFVLNIERAVDGTEETAEIKSVETYFGDDARKFEDLCEAFVRNFGLEVCEMEAGWRKKGGKGFEDVLLTLLRKGDGVLEKINDQGFQNVQQNNYLRNENKVLEEIGTCPMHLGQHIDRTFERDKITKLLHLFIAAEDFQRDDLISALEEFKYCTEDVIVFKYIPIDMEVDVSGKHWMDATYMVMEEATNRGIDFADNGVYDDVPPDMMTDDVPDTAMEDDEEVLFNTDPVMNLIILPDDTVFPEEGMYGFALVNSNLAVIKLKEAAEGKSVIHEIGHNLGLRHSKTSDGDEYGDDLCIMGDAKDNSVCFNGAKSDYLGLYANKTGYVEQLEGDCNYKFHLVPVKYHLSFGAFIEENYGDYLVNFRYDNSNGRYYTLMYNVEEGIVVLTVEDGRVSRTDEDTGRTITFAGESTRVFDLKEGESQVYDNLLFKRCHSTYIFPTVLFSTNPNAVNNNC